MARFRWEDDTLISDEHGDIEYHEALGALVEQASAKFEEMLWNLVDDLEYVVGEEQEEPADEELPED